MRNRVVDAEARRQAAKSLAEFVAGGLTNMRFDAAYPEESRDRGVQEIYVKVWHHYDDFREHRLDLVAADDLGTFRRCVLFLQTLLPFEWPSATSRMLSKIPSVRGFIDGSEGREPGDESVWPFYRRSDWERALSA